MILIKTQNTELKQKTKEFIETLRDKLPSLDKTKVEKSMGMTKAELNKLLKGEVEFSVIQLTKLSRNFNFSLKALAEGKIDIDSIIRKYQGKSSGMPQRYDGKIPRVKNYFLISTLNYTEQTYGPSLKKLALEYLQIEDHLYQDPEDYVNLEVLVDLLIFLHDHGMSEEGIRELGAQSFAGIFKLPVFSNYENPQDFFKYFYEEFATKEAASHYQFKPIENTESELVIQVSDSSETLDYMDGKPLGSPYCCLHMEGGFAEALRFKGIHHFEESHPQCRHRGDEYCIFKFKFK